MKLNKKIFFFIFFIFWNLVFGSKAGRGASLEDVTALECENQDAVFYKCVTNLARFSQGDYVAPYHLIEGGHISVVRYHELPGRKNGIVKTDSVRRESAEYFLKVTGSRVPLNVRDQLSAARARYLRTSGSGSTESAFFFLLKTVLFLLLLAGLGWIFLKVVKKKETASGLNNVFQSVASFSLGGTSSLKIVKIYRSYYIFAVSSNHTDFVAEVTDKEFKDYLDIEAAKDTGDTATFTDLIRRYLPGIRKKKPLDFTQTMTDKLKNDMIH